MSLKVIINGAGVCVCACACVCTLVRLLRACVCVCVFVCVHDQCACVLTTTCMTRSPLAVVSKMAHLRYQAMCADAFMALISLLMRKGDSND